MASQMTGDAKMTDLSIHTAAIAALCRQLGIQRLDVFGSAVRRELTPESDIDVVVRFDRSQGHMFTRYFDLKESLERIFSRPVDIVLEDRVTNPFFRESLERTRVNVYGAYDLVDTQIVWEAAREHLPILLRETEEQLNS
jgi:predicted nucleotidyltransferase